jgi:hypothetical protein
MRWLTGDSLIYTKVRSATVHFLIHTKVRSPTGDSFIQALDAPGNRGKPHSHQDAIANRGFLHPDQGRFGLTEENLR